MKQLRQRWLAEIRKIMEFPPEKRVWYIWTYYKLWITGILSIALLLTWGVYHYTTTNADNWFFACFANTRAELGDGSAFWEDYAGYAGYDLREKNLLFQADCYFDPTGSTYNNEYYNMLIAYMDSGSLDVLVMEEDRIQAMGASGRLMDLEDERLRDVFEQYENRLVYCEAPDGYEKEHVPVGIDLSGSVLTEEAYTEGAALAVNALAPHLDQVKIFLDFLFMNSVE